MDDNDPESKASSSLFSRFRSPSFQQSEVKALLKLIEKNKYALLNKSTNAAANNAKEKAWASVATEFNKLCLGTKRTMDMLKTKWENLKRNARKIAKDVMDDDCEFTNDEMKKTIMMICTAENIEYDEHNYCHANTLEDDGSDFKPWASDEDNNSTGFALVGEMEKETSTKYDTRTGFSPQDCRVLLQCVRQEKKVLFSNSPLSKRQEAWQRVAEAFNGQTPRKKTPKELNRKFNAMKSMARKVNFKGFFKNKKRKKYERLDDDKPHFIEKIKSEPIINCASDDFEFNSDDEHVLSDPVDNFNTTARHFTQDPLNNAHSSDSGLGSISDAKDAVRLKVELLNYKMETARLERKRIEAALKSEEREYELRAAELALRVRTARLTAAAAAAALPAAHPALQHTREEQRALQLCSSHLDIG